MSEPNISPDISEYFLPLTSEDLFGNTRKTALEIGFGEGEFIAEIADRFPAWNYIGIEVKYYRFKKALRLAESKGSENLKLIHIEAHIALQELFCPAIFDKVYINFPDPWPKEKHVKHRLINHEFLKNLHFVMKENAELEFVSDSGDYIEHTEYYFNTCSGFELITKNIDNVPKRPTTRFMEEFLREKRNIYYLSYRKVR